MGELGHCDYNDASDSSLAPDVVTLCWHLHRQLPTQGGEPQGSGRRRRDSCHYSLAAQLQTYAPIAFQLDTCRRDPVPRLPNHACLFVTASIDPESSDEPHSFLGGIGLRNCHQLLCLSRADAMEQR